MARTLWVANSQDDGVLGVANCKSSRDRSLKQTATMLPPSVAIKEQRNGENAPARCAGVVPSSERWTLGDELTHRQNATMHAILCKTSRRRRFPSYCEFATHRRAARRTAEARYLYRDHSNQ